MGSYFIVPCRKLLLISPSQRLSFHQAMRCFPTRHYSLQKYTVFAAAVCCSNLVLSSSFSLSPQQHRHSTTTTFLSSSTASMSSAATSTPCTPAEKLMALRQLFDQHNLDCYIVPSDDPHLSEYTPEAYKRRQFITEFGGSAGTALIFREEAKLWTDSRYYNEANLQLDGDHWDLMKQGLPETPTISNYIADAAKEHFDSNKKPFRIGMDPFVHAASFCKELEKALDEKNDNEDEKCGILETSLSNNLIDELWGESRPALPNAPFRVHEHAGKTVTEKVKAVREKMVEKKATMAVFSALDDVAYLFNIRAQGDIDTCPVGMAYGIITHNQVMLLCDKDKVANIQEYLDEAGITVKPYDAVLDQIKEHLETKDENTKKPKIWIDTTRSNYAIRSAIQEDKQLVDCQTAVTTMKACKNTVEMEGMKRAHVVDGAAMAHFISWLQEQISSGKKVSEVEIDEVLRNYRSQQPGYIEDSFPTIAGVGSNGAIIHYRAKEDSDLMKYLDAESSILIDSGGQYTYGTTDVTRYVRCSDVIFCILYHANSTISFFSVTKCSLTQFLLHSHQNMAFW